MRLKMRILFILFFLGSYLQAEIIRSTGIADPDYDNLQTAVDDARHSALESYQDKYYSKYRTCLQEEYSVDEDNYNTLLVREISVKMTTKHIIVEVEFEISEAVNNLDKQFQKSCSQKKVHAQYVQNTKDFFSHFHLGLEVFGWPGVYGSAGFFEYEYNGWALDALYSIQKLEDGVVNVESPDVGTASTAGARITIPILALANIRRFGFLLGYEQVLEHTNNFDQTLATNATTWGFSYTPDNSHFEYGLLFKNFNDTNELRDGSISGGILVRFKIF